MTERPLIRIEWYIRSHPGCTLDEVKAAFKSLKAPGYVEAQVWELVGDGVVDRENGTVRTGDDGYPVVGVRLYHRMTYRGPREERGPSLDVEDEPEDANPFGVDVEGRTVEALAPAVLSMCRRVYPGWVSMYDAAKEIADPSKEGYTGSILLARTILEYLHSNGELELRSESRGNVYRIAAGRAGSPRAVKIDRAKADAIWDAWLRINNGEKVDFKRTSLGTQLTLMQATPPAKGMYIRKRNGSSDAVTSVNWTLSETRREYIVFHTVRDYISVEVRDKGEEADI